MGYFYSSSFLFCHHFLFTEEGVVVFRTTFRAHGLHTLQLIARQRNKLNYKVFTLIFTLINKIIWKLCNIWYEWNFLHIVFFLVCHINGNSFAIALVFNSIHLCQMRKLLQFDEYDRSIRNLVPELFLQHIALI